MINARRSARRLDLDAPQKIKELHQFLPAEQIGESSLVLQHFATQRCQLMPTLSRQV
jgi:hypothetical protein